MNEMTSDPAYSALPTFRPFGKVPRWNREIVVTEKLDGTNGLIYVGPDGCVRAGGRTRWLFPGKATDNFGFAAWVESHKQELKALGPGYHHGEWWGQGINRGYGLREKRFSLFNVHRFGDLLDCPSCCHVVPVLWRGMPADCPLDQILDDLRASGSRAAPGFDRPEGVVIFHTAANQLFKVTLEKDEKVKGGPDADS